MAARRSGRFRFPRNRPSGRLHGGRSLPGGAQSRSVAFLLRRAFYTKVAWLLLALPRIYLLYPKLTSGDAAFDSS